MPSELFAENAIFFSQVVDRVLLALIEATGLCPTRSRVFNAFEFLYPTRNGIAPIQDDRGDRALILMYPLPDSAQRIASLCSEVLAFG